MPFLTPSENAKQAVDLDPHRVSAESLDRAAGRHLWKTLMLAPTLEICEAMLRGQPVPIDRLDPEWVRRFGMREAA